MNYAIPKNLVILIFHFEKIHKNGQPTNEKILTTYRALF